MEVFVQNSPIYCIFRLPSVTDRFNPNNQFPDPICYSDTLVLGRFSARKKMLEKKEKTRRSQRKTESRRFEMKKAQQEAADQKQRDEEKRRQIREAREKTESNDTVDTNSCDDNEEEDEDYEDDYYETESNHPDLIHQRNRCAVIIGCYSKGNLLEKPYLKFLRNSAK